MRLTWGIITDGTQDARLAKIVKAIAAENIPEYEILIVGNSQVDVEGVPVRIIPFNDSDRHMWITRKKNIIAQNARYHNIVFAHDYVFPMPGWYKGMAEYGEDWDICMTKIVETHGERYTDWSICAGLRLREIVGGGRDRERLLPYDELGLSRIQYISGMYWVAKRRVMLRFPLDETLVAGEGEDIEWSRRVRKVYDFSMNANSTVGLYKLKHIPFRLADRTLIRMLKEVVRELCFA